MKPDFDIIDAHLKKHGPLLHGSKPENTYIEYTTVYIN
jgi:hypothetical protein